MKIQAIIINGFHEGHSVFIDYQPIIKLLKPKTITVDYCCNNEEITWNEFPEFEEYKECFRAIDRRIVLYSKRGESEEFMESFIKQFTKNPWTKNTVLYFGYHEEPIYRTDGNKKRVLN